MKYGWAAYYKSAYEREKRKNTILAGQVADAEAKREELSGKYERICANPLYRMWRPFARIKRIPGKCRELFMQRKLRAGNSEGASEALQRSYEERLFCQTDGYAQWIKEEEPALYKKEWEKLLEKGENGKEGYAEKKKTAAVYSYAEIEKEKAEADVLIFAAKPEELDERALSYIEAYFTRHPETQLFYGAEDCICPEDGEAEAGKRAFPWFKPCWSPDTLLGFFYVGSYFAVAGEAARRISTGGYADFKENVYDFLLQAALPLWTGKDSASKVCCTDLVLYHRRAQAPPTEKGAPGDREYFLHSCEMLPERHPEFWGYERKYIDLKKKALLKMGYASREYQTLHPQAWSLIPLCREEKEPLVSVVIPTKDHPEILKKCIGSFLEKTAYAPVEFIVVDNGSSRENREKTESFLQKSGAAYRYLYEPMTFNFSAMCNKGAAVSKGEFILLLNDDIEIIEENWLAVMLGQAVLPGTGAVGAKLWYPEGEKIQHTGITNMHIGPSHKLVTFPDDRIYYYGQNSLSYNRAAVTAACLLIKRSLYEEAGGLDETMRVSYNDVDFCLKLIEAGYRNVIRNDAVLLHHESLSRGLDEDSEEKWDRLLQEKKNLYEKHPLFNEFDPFYSEMLADNAPEYRIGYKYPYERPLLVVSPEKKTGKAFLEKQKSAAVMLTVERSGKQHKLHLGEPDICMTEGWCYMLNQDNAVFNRWMILELEGEDVYYQAPVQERHRPDVEAILPAQKHIGLSGFTCRILNDDLIKGNYTIGMLYKSEPDGRFYYQRSDMVMKVNY